MTYDLSKLGWKAFQDLACAVAAEVVQRPVQTFLGSKDGGRDGAFVGTWDDGAGATAKSTIQCKFIGKSGAALTLANLKDELPKAKKLAENGLAEDYIILTNADVSGIADEQICAAFTAAGVSKCRVFGGSWIAQQLMERPRLRMLVPRVYGIGDLSHIITGHGYKQAKAILDSMGSDLSCFVPTEAYRLALDALHKHGFLILLGDPASGKSTIAAILALGALDDDCLGALKINSPDQFNLWHPGERQFLWVDDAFGPNQFDVSRMSRWNAELGTLRAAVDGGARVVFTSRNYIWEAAKPHLKMSAFPLMKESQVVVNVQALTPEERAQMLYNHVRRTHPREMRQRLKPFLPAISSNKAFLPETARRLGDPIFMNKLALTEWRLNRLVEHPVEFLTEILSQLDEPSRGAIALIFLNNEKGVPSPIPPSPSLDMVTRLLGVHSADIARSMQHLNDSLTRLVSQDDGDRWVFRHPTVTDAFAALVANSPELVELYAHGAKLNRLMREVVCGPMTPQGGRLRIPTSLYPALVQRLNVVPLDESLKSFLGARCDKTFLRLILDERPEILTWAMEVSKIDLSLGSRLLLAALKSYGLLPETTRVRLVEKIQEDSITWLNASPFEDEIIQQLFTAEEFQKFTDLFQNEWLSDLPNLLDDLKSRFSSDDEIAMFNDFKENLQKAERFYSIEELEYAFSDLYVELDAYIEQLEAERREEAAPSWRPPTSEQTDDYSSFNVSTTIFRDVDD
jgi:hypothetical protein